MRQASSVIYMGSFAGSAPDYADVMLPVSPFTETSGTFVNIEGRAQSFQAVTAGLGDTRPAWKVLRVLGNLLGLDGFDYASSEQVRDEALPKEASLRFDNSVSDVAPFLDQRVVGTQRIPDVPIYFADPLVRRAPALQRTRDAALPSVRVAPSMLGKLGVDEGANVKVSSASGEALLRVRADSAIPEDCCGLSAGHPATVALGAMFGVLKVERA
jgi:NADH-quinone oxidoreductase subunit G